MKNIAFDTNPIYIILHLHKCGGVSQAKHIINHIKNQEFYGFYHTANPYLENRSAIKAFISFLPPEKKNRIRVLMGHGVYYGIHNLFLRPCRYVVFLRDPHARTISNYAFFVQNTRTGYKKRKSVLDRRGQIYDFHDWLRVRTVMHDYMTRFLYRQLFYKNIQGEVTERDRLRVQNLLKTFYLVGLLERPIDHWFLYHSLGLPLRASHEHKTEAQFYPDNILHKDTAPFLTQDSKLYEYFRQNPQPVISYPVRATLSLQFIIERLIGT